MLCLSKKKIVVQKLWTSFPLDQFEDPKYYMMIYKIIYMYYLNKLLDSLNRSCN